MRRGNLVAFLIAYVLKLHKIVFIAIKNWKHMISKSENLSSTKGYHLFQYPFPFSVRLGDPLFGI